MRLYIKQATKKISDYMKQNYHVNLSKDDKEFLAVILLELRNKAHAEGYNECFEEERII